MWPFEEVDAEKTKTSIFEEMQKLGADYAEARYSGGNDEGGVDDVSIYRHVEGGERLQLELPESADYYDSPIRVAFDDLLSIDFGTWAGEFEAYGTVYADLRERKIWREGEVTTYASDESAGTY